MKHLYVSWDEYHLLIEKLAVKIYDSPWEFNQILCLARGGLNVGNILSRIFNLPLAILSASSYGDDKERGKLHFSRDLTMTTNNLGSHVLLVDDMVDSGITLEQTIIWLNEHYPQDIKEVKTGVIWYKECSTFAPDYYVDYLIDNPWIHQPFEIYEEMTIEEIARKIPRENQS